MTWYSSCLFLPLTIENNATKSAISMMQYNQRDTWNINLSPNKELSKTHDINMLACLPSYYRSTVLYMGLSHIVVEQKASDLEQTYYLAHDQL